MFSLIFEIAWAKALEEVKKKNTKSDEESKMNNKYLKSGRSTRGKSRKKD